jgi:hypothetical protein
MVTATDGSADSCLGNSGLASKTGALLGLAIDPSGNVWTIQPASGAVIEIVGVAAPVSTPLAGPVQPLS